MGLTGTKDHFHDAGGRVSSPHATRRRHGGGDHRYGGRDDMTPVHALMAKELRSYFVSPVVYVVGAIFLLIFGVLSYLAVVNAGAQAVRLMQLQGAAAQLNLNDLVFRPTFYSMALVVLLVVPLLTMRLFAEERKLRTFELLMTSPIGLNEVVVGKFLGAYAIYLALLALTGIVPLIL